MLGRRQGYCRSTIDFWLDWLREEDPNPARKVCPELLLCIIRAISWVESKHGCGGGNHPERDPMQVGNPGDVGWQNIGVNPSTDPDKRPIREGQLPGLSWQQISPDVDGIINPTTPSNPPALPYPVNPLFASCVGPSGSRIHQRNELLLGNHLVFLLVARVFGIGGMAGRGL